MPTRFLADYLRYFYFNLRCQDGTFYSPRSLVCYRASIQRYLTSPEVNRTVNILKDSEFNRANGVLKAMVGKWIKEGNKGKKYPAIEPEDLNRIRNYFDRSNPDSLQHEVWFNITYYFGLRGREIVCQLSKGDLEIDSDSDGRTFISLKKDFLSKNVKCSLSQKEFETVSVARMYADDSCSSKCPVECMSETLFRHDSSRKSPSLSAIRYKLGKIGLLVCSSPKNWKGPSWKVHERDFDEGLSAV